MTLSIAVAVCTSGEHATACVECENTPVVEMTERYGTRSDGTLKCVTMRLNSRNAGALQPPHPYTRARQSNFNVFSQTAQYKFFTLNGVKVARRDSTLRNQRVIQGTAKLSPRGCVVDRLVKLPVRLGVLPLLVASGHMLHLFE
jgi:hypothetical protein